MHVHGQNVPAGALGSADRSGQRERYTGVDRRLNSAEVAEVARACCRSQMTVLVLRPVEIGERHPPTRDECVRSASGRIWPQPI